jgi:hypothetical protein
MSELSYAQLTEAKFRFFLKERYPTLSSFSYPNQSMIDQIESILAVHPELKTFNYHQLGISALRGLVKQYIEDVDIYYYKSDEVLIIVAEPIKSFLTMKEFIVMFLLSALTDISFFHFIFSKKKLETLECQYVESFPYIYENSVVLNNEDKQQYHFITSISSIIDHIYLLPDEFIKNITSRSKLPNKHGDSTIADYIECNKLPVNVEDIALTAYLKNNPQNIDFTKLSKRKNNNKP